MEVNTMPKGIVFKDNTLINASYTISLTEQRILLLSIAKARKNGSEINHNDYISIHASEFVETFKNDKNTVYRDLKKACDTLFSREFSYKKGGRLIRSHWLQSSIYDENKGSIAILFAKELIPFVSQLKERFTSYFLQDVARMTSVYAIRLYELIIAWKSTHKTPVIEIEELRVKLGVEPSEYPRMDNFKNRVLYVAINQINELSNIQIKMTQHKKGRSITGFSFTFVEINSQDERDPNTRDWIEESECRSSQTDIKAITAKMTDSKPKKRARKVITQQQAELLARTGETWTDLLNRIKDDYFVKFDEKPKD